MEEKKHKGLFWQTVSFSKAGTPFFPEGFMESEVPDYEAAVDEKTLAKVKFSAGRSINLGDFNNARVDIGVELPCHIADIDNAMRAAEEFVGPRYASLVNEIISSKGSLNSGSGQRQYLTEKFSNKEKDTSEHY